MVLDSLFHSPSPLLVVLRFDFALSFLLSFLSIVTRASDFDFIVLLCSMASYVPLYDAAVLTTPFVHFTVLYRLRQRAKSLTVPRDLCEPAGSTARHTSPHASPSLLPHRGSCTSVYSVSAHDTNLDRRRPSLLQATVHRDQDAASPPLHRSPTARRGDAGSRSMPTLRPTFSASADIRPSPTARVSPSFRFGSRQEEGQEDVVPSSTRVGSDGGDTTLLSTLDKRELSKIVARDAVFAQLLDVVPSRQHVQTAVWTLSDTLLQFDGAVAVRPMFESEPPRHVSAHVAEEPDESIHARVTQRVKDMIIDATLFAAILRPYLGEWACLGDVELAQVDGVNV